MRRLMLLRHAKSSWPSGMQDAERPLSDHGESAARLMGGYMAHHALIPDRVLCSPARRTRATWTGVSGVGVSGVGVSGVGVSGVSASWPAGANAVFDGRLYGATRQGIVAIIREQDEAVHTLLIIGHNPGMQETAEWLIAAGDVGQRERLREKFPTAALAVIDFSIDTWSDVHELSGRLDRYITPRAVAAATS